MTFESLLVQQAQILRHQGGVDPMGQPLSGNWEVVATYPCRISQLAGGGERMNERQYEVYQTSRTIFLPADADVQEDDKVRVLDSGGAEIAPAAHIHHKQVVVGLDGTAHHLELATELTRGPQ